METAVMNTNALVVMSQPQMLEKLQHSEVPSSSTFTLLPLSYFSSPYKVFILQSFRTCASSLCTHISFVSFSTTSVLVFLSFSVQSLSCSHYYIVLCPLFYIIILTISAPFLIIVSLMFATPVLTLIFSFLIFSILVTPDHPSQHSHLHCMLVFRCNRRDIC